MVLYALVARAWPGLTAAALATVAIGSLGAVAAGGLARDELGDGGAYSASWTETSARTLVARMRKRRSQGSEARPLPSTAFR